MAIYCWGSSVNGELGLGGIEEEHIMTPRELTIPRVNSPIVKQIACGEFHTVVLLDDGSAYSCGRNDVGQLGHSKSCKRLGLVEGLQNATIVQVACGSMHSIAISKWGSMYSWGDNSGGQLGRPDATKSDAGSASIPKLVKSLATKHVVQIACGNDHCIALLNDGLLFSWGRNDYGQLGFGTKSQSVNTPSVISALDNVPVAHVACGGHHSFVVTCLGAVYGWGRNSFGQLGLNDSEDRVVPTESTALRSQRIRYIACGVNHTVALTDNGGVYTWGAGTYGQLGHGTNNLEILPRKVLELMGNTIGQISCGRQHTLCYDPHRGRVYAFGQGGSGQLGVKNSTKNLSVPTVVNGSWTEPSKSKSKSKSTDVKVPDVSSPSALPLRIFGGGDRSFVVAAPDGPSVNQCTFSTEGQILKMDVDMAERLASAGPDEIVPQDIIEYVETVFRSPACINASFISDDFSAASNDNPYIDMDQLKKFLKVIGGVQKDTLTELILECLCGATIPSLAVAPTEKEALRVYLIVLGCCCFNDRTTFDPTRLLIPLGKAILVLSHRISKVLSRWWSVLDRNDFSRLVTAYKQSLLTTLVDLQEDLPKVRLWTEAQQLKLGEKLQVAARMLDRLNRANNEHGELLNYEEFCIPELPEVMDVRLDYINWLNRSTERESSWSSSVPSQRLFLCDYPFLFDASAKTFILQTDAILQMQDAIEEANRRTLASLFLPIDPESAYLVLFVSRENLVHDTLAQLTNIDAQDLKKPLKVVFSGEEAIDAGGLRKEFFMLLLKEVIDPKYGMFKVYAETLSIWFNENTFETEDMFYLIGLLCGLAIYNGNIINLPFPLALYRKLLGEPVRFEDLRGLSPVMHNGLQQMLEYKGDDFQDTFPLRFEVNVDAFDEVKVKELLPGGSSIVVTEENRHEYVQSYVKFVFYESVEKQYAAFHKGFHRVCGGRVLRLFHAQELMAMIVGNEHYDWLELQNNAEYKGEFTAEHPTIKMLWQVFHEDLTLEQKKKFLLFLTGYDRIPIFGMKSVKIVVQSTAGGDDFLPVAHTCFNLLDLPVYKDKNTLLQKLLLAIEHTQGFTLV